MRTGAGDGAFIAGVEAEADASGSDCATPVAGLPDPPPSAMFDHVYAQPHPGRPGHQWWQEYLGDDHG
ncbi:MAG: hypothetical protein U0R23_09315 [Candidatus Nanopelagicales bacterium]